MNPAEVPETDPQARFTQRATDYAVARPSYPDAIVAAVLEGFEHPSVADLGAGTGISSRLLADAGARVFAVEPNASMRSHIVATRRVHPVDGRAEETHLHRACVDVVTAFQAFHWFDRDGVVREVHRIARARARFAAVWNHRDNDDAFMEACNAIFDRYSEENRALDRARRESGVLALFAANGWPRTRIVRAAHVQEMTWPAFAGYVHSASYLPQRGDGHDAMMDELHELFERAQQAGRIGFRWVAEAHLAERQ